MPLHLQLCPGTYSYVLALTAMPLHLQLCPDTYSYVLALTAMPLHLQLCPGTYSYVLALTAMPLHLQLCPDTYSYVLALTAMPLNLQLCPGTYSYVLALTAMPLHLQLSLHYTLALTVSLTNDPQYNSHSSAVRRHSFDPQAVRVGFVAYKVALGRVFLRALPFYPISIILPIPHILNHLVHTDTISSDTRTVHVSSACQQCMSAVHVGSACRQCMSAVHVGSACQQCRSTNRSEAIQLSARDPATSLSVTLLLWKCSVLRYRSPFFIFFLPFSFSPIVAEVENGQQLASSNCMIKKWPKTQKGTCL